MKPDLSIVVPVYNAEKYLERCLNSIINPNYNYEIILVDDGSQDNSGKICDEFAKQYPFIKVHHKTNGGVSSARNFGIDHAKGDYITFIDADDYVSKLYFLVVFDFIKNIYTDCFLFNLYREDLDGNFTANKLPISDGFYRDRARILSFSLSQYSFANASYTKIYKLKLIKENNLRFNENIKICEDNIFAVDYFECIHHYTISNLPLYYYTVSPGSATQKRKLQYFSDDNVLFMKYLEIILCLQNKKLTKDRLYNTYLRRCFYNIDNLTKQKVSKRLMMEELNKTEMCDILLSYKFTLNRSTKILKKRLFHFSKGYWLRYYFWTMAYNLYNYLYRVFDSMKFKETRWRKIEG